MAFYIYVYVYIIYMFSNYVLEWLILHNHCFHFLLCRWLASGRTRAPVFNSRYEAVRL